MNMSSLKCFFKVILRSTLREHKLKISVKFVKKYGKELSDLVRLTNPTGAIWRVRAENIENTMWFHEGLQKFMEDHSIKLGYFLIFKYKGNSTFKVHIFDLSASEIEYPNRGSDSARPSDVNQLPISDQEEDDHDDGHCDKTGDEHYIDHQSLGRVAKSSEFAYSNKLSSGVSAETSKLNQRNQRYLTRSKKKMIQDDGEIESIGIQDSTRATTHNVIADEAMLVSSSKGDRKINSRTRHIEVKTNRATNMSLPKNPLYVCILKKFNVYKNFVNIPSEFARSYLSCTSQFIKLQDPDGNESEVYCICRKNNACQLSKGWAKFVTEKNLMVGDVCVFEPIRINEEVKLKVKTSRKAIDHAANPNYKT